MNPSQQQPMTTTATTTTSSKVRLMLSYGGQILPRPNNFNALFYSGGDTRILAVDRRVTSTIAAFTSHISSSVKINQPFVVKYQLPNHDLDSLITVTSDDDLFILFDEYDRIAGAASSRLRLFLFPLKQQQQQQQRQQQQQQQKHHQLVTATAAANTLLNSPPDSWFSDTLKSAKIMRRKDACLEDKSLGSLQESVVRENSSSFGSSSSSGSSTNAPSNRVHVEETVLKLPQPDPLLSNIDPASGISHTKIGIIQDPIVDVATISGIASPHDELRSNLPSAYSPQVYAPVPFSGYPMPAQPPQQPLLSQQQQPQQHQMQFVQANSQYTYYPTGPLSNCSNSPMYSQLPPYQTQYRPNQGYPFYMLPISQTQPFNSSVQSNLIDTGITTTTAPTTASQPLMCSNIAIAPTTASQPLICSNVATAPPQMSYNDVAVVQPAAEYASKVYKANPVAIPVPIASTQNQLQLAAIQPLPLVPQSVVIPLVEATNKFSNVADDPAYDLIYKTQPSAPTMPSQFQITTVPTTALLLPEELTKLHVSEDSQQLRV